VTWLPKRKKGKKVQYSLEEERKKSKKQNEVERKEEEETALDCSLAGISRRMR